MRMTKVNERFLRSVLRENIKKDRYPSNLKTQKQMAKALNLDQSHVSLLMSGKSRPTMDLAISLYRARYISKTRFIKEFLQLNKKCP